MFFLTIHLWQVIFIDTELFNNCAKAGKGIVLVSPPDSAAEEMETAECSEQKENDAERKHKVKAEQHLSNSSSVYLSILHS